jgi:hypothetical protein
MRQTVSWALVGGRVLQATAMATLLLGGIIGVVVMRANIVNERWDGSNIGHAVIGPVRFIENVPVADRAPNIDSQQPLFHSLPIRRGDGSICMTTGMPKCVTSDHAGQINSIRRITEIVRQWPLMSFDRYRLLHVECRSLSFILNCYPCVGSLIFASRLKTPIVHAFRIDSVRNENISAQTLLFGVAGYPALIPTKASSDAGSDESKSSEYRRGIIEYMLLGLAGITTIFIGLWLGIFVA